MVDAALPRSDRVDLPDEEEIQEIKQIATRVAERSVAQSPTPKIVDAATVKLPADEWRRLINSLPAASPLVTRVLGAIRKHLERGGKEVSVTGSVLGWNALNTALFDQAVCLSLAIKITEQVARQTV